VLAAPDKRKDLAARAKVALKGCTSEFARERVELVRALAKEWREEEPSSSWLGLPEAHAVYANGATALAVDFAIARGLEKAEAVILHRDGSESEGGLEQEFESGQLYRLSADERPILMVRPTAPQLGHLFCDVKDFTRRTAFLKEAVVADFLSREFYTPILTAAARHHHGATHLGDKGGIYLNNLLGDAVSFAGEVVALIELAHDIRAALQNYGRRLDAEGSSEAVASSAAAIEQRSAARKRELEALLQVARAAQAQGQPDPATGEDAGLRQRALLGELARLEDDREAELSLARGEKLEAGIFISFGAAPEVATFEDAVFGAIKVAIAEKINESARGTARNGGVRARVDSLVAQARLTRGKPELSCPFHVLIGQPLSIPVSPETEAAIRLCLKRGDTKGAEALLGEGVRGLISRLSSERKSEAFGDIYNGGAALSEEALRAYVSARRGNLLFLEREVPVAQLHAALRDRFVFPMESLKLIAAVSEQGPSLHELYVYAGRALFKGLEKTGGLGVYELIAPRAPFASMIAQHHLPVWLREEQERAPPPADEWQGRQSAGGRPPRSGGGG
jgi:class 3 adenylate cyclase